MRLTRQCLGLLNKFSSRIAHRDRGLRFLQIGFEKMVGDDQRLDGLPSIAAARRNAIRFMRFASKECVFR